MEKLSEYEQLREQNLRERMKLLEDLELKQAADDFTDLVKKPRTLTTTTTKRKHPTRRSGSSGVRRSLRLLERDPGVQDARVTLRDQSVKAEEKEIEAEKDEDYDDSGINNDSVVHSNIYFSHGSSYSGSFTSNAQNEISLIKKSLNSSDALSQYEKWTGDDAEILQQVSKLKMHGRVKVGGSHNRALSFCFHPSTSKILVLVGCNTGSLWIGDLTEMSNRKCSSFEYNAHTVFTPIPCIAIPNEDPQTAYMCAYDSTVKKFDFEKFTIHPVYAWEDDNSNRCKSLDFISSTSILVARQQASFALIDTRTGNNELPDSHNVEKRVNCISVNPVEKKYFVTSAATGAVKLWDVRKVSHEVQCIMHAKSVRSALYSPLTGRSVLTTSYENTLNVFTTADDAAWAHFERETRLSHNNQTGRWLTPFSAVWHPRSEAYFMCGSLESRRRVDIFGRNGVCKKSLMDLGAVCSLTGFHPVYNMVIGLNSSTYLHVWI